MNNFYGDSTRWFIGDVYSIQDPLKVGRIQVRIHGLHSESQLDIPDDSLPWAQVVAPITEGGTLGLNNALGVQPGALVFGIFLDGLDSQLPLIFGSLPKLESRAEVSSLSNEAQNTDYNGTKLTTLHDGKTRDPITGEPASPYAAVYPNNKVTRTTSGHAIEIDDTNGAERIHIFHKSGTFVEMHPNGDVVTHMKNGFKTVTGNDKLHVTGTMDIVVDGNMNINVTGDVAMNGATINLNNGDPVRDKAARLNDTAIGIDPAGIAGGTVNSVINSASKTVFIGDGADLVADEDE